MPMLFPWESYALSKSLLCALVLTGTTLQACTLLGPHSEPTTTGTVTGVFVEPYSGILVDRVIQPRREDMPTWVEVRLSSPLRDGRRTLQARVADPDIAMGTVVDVRLAGRSGSPQTEPAVTDLRLPGRLALRTAAVSAGPFISVATAKSRFEVSVESR